MRILLVGDQLIVINVVPGSVAHVDCGLRRHNGYMAGGPRSGSAGQVLEAEGSGREADVDVATGRPWSESVSASGSPGCVVPGPGAGWNFRCRSAPKNQEVE